MLDFMRRQHSKLKWVLVFVIVLLGGSMVVGYIPFGDLGSVSISNDIATVGSETVTAVEFQTTYANYLNNLQQQQQQLSPELLKAFGIDRQILSSLIGQKVIMSEAKRLGLSVTPEEIQQQVLSDPTFLAGGSFIGLDRYEALLLQNNLTAERYENLLRGNLTVAKVASFVTAGVTVTDNEVEDEYRRRNEKAVLNYFLIDADAIESRLPAPSEQELKEYFEKNQARYNIPEKRNVKYAFASMIEYRRTATATDDELRTYYGEHSEEYRIPGQVTAQHILFKTEGKTNEEVEAIRQKATDVLGRAKKGEDFSKLAQEFSEDSTASTGGNLGTFGRGTMVPAFEQAAFSLEPGAISDLVTTEFGFHIIKVNEKQEERVRTFDEVKEAIRPLVLFAKGRDKAKEVAEEIALEVVNNKDLAAVAAQHDITAEETGLIQQTASIAKLGNASDLMSKVFTMPKDEIGVAIEVENGYVVPQVIDVQAAHPATFDEVRATVISDAKRDKSRELATENTNKIREQIDAGTKDLGTLARTLGAEVKTSEKIARAGSIPEFGSIAERDQEIFSLPLGQVGPVTSFGGKTLVFSVKSRDAINQDEMKKEMEDIRKELLPAKRDRYFEAYILEAQKRMEQEGSISINERALAQIVDQIQ